MEFWENAIIGPPVIWLQLRSEATVFWYLLVIWLQWCVREHRLLSPLWFDSNRVLREQCAQSPRDMTPVVFWENTILSRPWDMTEIVLWDNTIVSHPYDLITMMLTWTLFSVTPVIWLQWSSEWKPFSVPSLIWLQRYSERTPFSVPSVFDTTCVLREHCSQALCDLKLNVFWENTFLSPNCDLNPMVFLENMVLISPCD